MAQRYDRKRIQETQVTLGGSTSAYDLQKIIDDSRRYDSRKALDPLPMDTRRQNSETARQEAKTEGIARGSDRFDFEYLGGATDKDNYSPTR